MWYSTIGTIQDFSGTSSWLSTDPGWDSANAVVEHVFDGDFDVVIKVRYQSRISGGIAYGNIPAGTSLRVDQDSPGCTSQLSNAANLCGDTNQDLFCSGGTICGLGLSHAGCAHGSQPGANSNNYYRYARVGNTLYHYKYVNGVSPGPMFAEPLASIGTGSDANGQQWLPTPCSGGTGQTTVLSTDRAFITLGENSQPSTGGWFDVMYYEYAVAFGFPHP